VVAVNWLLLVVSLLAVELWLQWEKLKLPQKTKELVALSRAG